MSLAYWKDVAPALQGESGRVWLRPVDRSTVSFTVEESDEAHLYLLDVEHGTCRRTRSLPRPTPTGNIWKTCEIASNQGSIYALVRHGHADYRVQDASLGREVVLPIQPSPDYPLDTVTDFWADGHGVVYLTDSSGLAGESFVVACGWDGRVRWTVGLDTAYPHMDIHFWETALCPQEDGSYVVFFNGDTYEAGVDEKYVGLLWISPTGALRDIYRLPWAAITSDDIIDGGGGFIVDGKAYLVAHITDTSIIRGKEGDALRLPSIQTRGTLAFTGVVSRGGRVMIGRGEGGVTVYQVEKASGLEPAVRTHSEKTGLEPSLSTVPLIEMPFALDEAMVTELLEEALHMMYLQGVDLVTAIDDAFFFTVDNEVLDADNPLSPVFGHVDRRTHLIIDPDERRRYIGAMMVRLLDNQTLERVIKGAMISFSGSFHYASKEQFVADVRQMIMESGYVC